MSASMPPGRQTEEELAALIGHIADELDELRGALPGINDEILHPRVEQLVALGPGLRQAHGLAPGADLADALAGLRDAAQSLQVPLRDPVLGEPTPTLRRVREAKGLIVAATDDALRCAATLGWRARTLTLSPETAAAMTRAAHRQELRGIEQRLEKVETDLRVLDQARHETTSFVQQNGLLNLYVPGMRVEVDLARVHLKIGETTVDLAALARAAQAMGVLTRDFVATVRDSAWARRVSASVQRGAEHIRGSVGRFVRGVRILPRIIEWRDRRQGRHAMPVQPFPYPIPEMVEIPAGRFLMGIPEEESRREKSLDDDARPVHEVIIARPFWLGKYPVTRAEYDAFVNDTGYEQDGGAWRGPGFPQTDRDPVVNVSHRDAEAYVAWLRAKTGQPFRLPSEAEWEYAARAGTTTARYWGNSLRQAARYAHSRAKGTAPVGSLQPNAFALYDMLGNVWEWTADTWHDSYDGAPNDGSAWIDHQDVRRVLRGGAWNFNPRNIRAGYRNRIEADVRGSRIGFRLARTSF